MLNKKLLFGLARLPLHRRRPLLSAAWSMARLSGRAQSLGLQRTFETVMRFPTKDAIGLAREADFHNVMSMLEWAQLKFRSLDKLLAEDAPNITIENEGVLAQLAAERRSLILTPLHMGAYVLSLALLIQRYFQGRRVLILLNHIENDEMTTILRRIMEVGCEVRFMGIRDKAGYVDALRFARKDAVIVCFCDLPSSYGVPFETELFTQPARIAMGIDMLARACNAVVVPVAANSFLFSETVKVRQPFELGEDGPGERRRVAGLIRQHMETMISEAPAQWHMWPRFDEYLVTPRELTA